MTLGKRIVAQRKRLGLTQDRLAELLQGGLKRPALP